MLAVVHTCAVVGLDGYIVDVEVDFNPRAGVPSFTIVGLPDTAVKESRERVRSAIKNSNRASSRRVRGRSQGTGELASMLEDQSLRSQEEHGIGLQFPNKSYTVNLSPGDLPKHGPAYDLAIAVGVLAATDQVPMESLERALFIGELSLDGSVRHVKGTMAMVYTACAAGYDTVYVAADDAPQAALTEGVRVIPVQTLGQLVEHLYGLNPIAPYLHPPDSTPTDETLPEGIVDFRDVRGQEHVKRALEIAAGGNHNVLLSGSPGVGKTLLARAMPGILPPLSREEALEVTRIYSVADMLTADNPLMHTRPFRAPHHTISQAGLVGGGSTPKPGEVSLSHRGVLFLDEIVEMHQKTLEVMRQPIEDKVVTISRAKGSLTFPANFLLVAAMNPCQCGYYGDTVKPCHCTPAMITRYQSKISGPLLDRIDLYVEVPRVDYDKLLRTSSGEPSSAVRARVARARMVQQARFAGTGFITNSDMTISQMQQFCTLTPSARQLLDVSVRRMQLSARSYHRVLKLSRTIADLDGVEVIDVVQIAEAIQYRVRTLSQ